MDVLPPRAQISARAGAPGEPLASVVAPDRGRGLGRLRGPASARNLTGMAEHDADAAGPDPGADRGWWRRRPGVRARALRARADAHRGQAPGTAAGLRLPAARGARAVRLRAAQHLPARPHRRRRRRRADRRSPGVGGPRGAHRSHRRGGRDRLRRARDRRRSDSRAHATSTRSRSTTVTSTKPCTV